MTRNIKLTGAVPIDKNLMKFLYYGEEVKALKGMEGYYITNFGRVFSGKKGIEYVTITGNKLYAVNWKELQPMINKGYHIVSINSKKEYVHKLVYEAFKERVDTTVLKIVHLDGDKTNNNIDNLGLQWRRKKDYKSHIEYCRKKQILSMLNDYSRS